MRIKESSTGNEGLKNTLKSSTGNEGV